MSRYRPINCKVCGVRVEPTSGMQKYCKRCAEDLYPTKRKPIMCAVCGVLVLPTSGSQKYCIPCGKALQNACKKNWSRTHPEAKKLANKNWYESHKEQCRIVGQIYNEKNPEIIGICAHNRRARKNGNGGSYTADELNELRIAQHNRCHYCNQLLTKWHREHKTPISRGGTNYIWNIALACPKCNKDKHLMTEDEFMAWRLYQEVINAP